MKKYGLVQRRIILRLPNSISIKNAVMHGVGLACVVASVSQQEIAHGQLVAIETDPALPKIPIKLMIRENILCRALLEAFIPSLIAAQGA